MTNVRAEFTFKWFIQNYSYCLYNNGERLISSDFTPNGFHGTTWYLHLYPRGRAEENKSHISISLCRDEDRDGPEFLPLKFELSFLAYDGSVLITKETEHAFKKGVKYGFQNFVLVDEVLFRRKEDFLPNDILSVRCKMWRGDGHSILVTHMSTVKHIEIERVSYLHVVKDFSTLKSNQKNTIEISSPSTGVSFLSSVYFCDDSCCGKIMVEITSLHGDDICAKCKLFLQDESGKVIECGKIDRRFDVNRESIQKVPLLFARKEILDRKREYLPDDKLSLLCDCIFNTGIKEKIAITRYQLPLVHECFLNNNDQVIDAYNAVEKLSACSSALDDIIAAYNNKLLTDMELKTKTKSFSVHKILLCARSSVFKTMLAADMKEKYMNCIHVDDLDNDTVQQLLLFLYSDNLEKLQWKSAINLYYAGDKYAIERLKVLCSIFLMRNITTSNVIELLQLADTHNDLDLRNFVENFILKHEKEVYGSVKWEKLAEMNPQLVNRTMLLKYRRNRRD